MRKTIYKTLVKTYVTCEERCSLQRVAEMLKRIAARPGNEGAFIHIKDMCFFRYDVEKLIDLVDYTYDNTPSGVTVTLGDFNENYQVDYVPEAEK